jgi:DNA-binding MltR family transcriptional regulator
MTEPINVTEAVDRKRAAGTQMALDEKLTDAERITFYDQASDRAMAIVLGAILENHLTELLRLVMRRDKKIADELFNPIGPLGPFGVKARIAYMLRLISEEAYRDLITASRIRNRFAHDLAVTSLEDQQITAWIKNMNMYKILEQMRERASARRENRDQVDRIRSAADFHLLNSAGNIKTEYRDCIRFMLHSLIDYENAIKSHEEELNTKQQSAPI